ncbi:MAG TPA: paraquat-inducible protein A [Opitutus sp.]|nr:paraquat-inducible protein A [Opitutus sp.]
MSAHGSPFVCALCGLEHQPIALAHGERALCRRCDTVMAQRSRVGPDAALVFTLTGLLLALPAFLQPFITAGKFGQQRGGVLFTGVEGLWDNGMPFLAIWVLLCGAVVPIVLLGILAAGLLRNRLGWSNGPSEWLSHTAHALSYWAIPEVHVLAVLVALMKLGAVVDVTIGVGFWCYIGMSISLLLAWRNFMLKPPELPSSTSPGTGVSVPAIS